MSKYLDILKKYWGYPSFRPLQEDIILSVARDKKDTLGLLPTGGGKSIIFQVPALAEDGICIVITPLIALMKDQVENLKKRGIKAIAIYSGLSRDEIDSALDNCIYGGYKFCYVSPERLETDLFKIRAQKMKVNLVAIDESHCISQWGYDFRPSYLKIAKLRELIPNTPFLALTATATPKVVDDIQEKLKFKVKNVFKKSFERENLIYIVRHIEDKQKYLLKIAQKMNASGVVYVRSRKKTKEIAFFLQQNGISADYYHAGIKNEFKDKKQLAWKKGRCKVIVATNAFGMGIDKPDVRFVVHMDLPDSLEAYFQEAGRAGRDEKRAYGVLLYNDSDRKKAERLIETTFPERKIIKQIYQALGNYYQIPVGSGQNQVYDFKLAEFAANYKFDFLTIHNSLKYLQKEGYIEFTEEVNNPSRIKFIVKRDDLYKFQVKNAKFDNFIKLVLRSYTGLFTDYVKIDEDFLAKRAKTHRQQIYNYLVKLSNHGIINYIPQKSCPQVIYSEERLDNRSLFLSKENYEQRKKRFTDKIEAMLHYATSTDKCRSQLLLKYFGQKNAPKCGKCDVCMKKNEMGLGQFEFEYIQQKIINTLADKNLTTEQLTDSIDKKPDKIIKVIRWMLDNKEIKQNQNKKLYLTGQKKE